VEPVQSPPLKTQRSTDIGGILRWLIGVVIGGYIGADTGGVIGQRIGDRNSKK